MIQVNNALSEVFGQKQWKDMTVGIYFFEGGMPTKSEMDIIVEGLTTTMRLGDYYKYIEANQESKNIKFLGEILSERTHDGSLRTKEAIQIPISSDPAEMRISESGTPTHFILHAFPGSLSDSYSKYSVWNNSSQMVEYTIIGTVGEMGSGADVEIKGGNIVVGNTYKLNDVVARILEP